MPDSPQPQIPFRDPDAAPFIYFDFAPAYGVLAGAIQIELAARVLTPHVNEIANSNMTVARLRCGPIAAAELRNALDKALELFRQSMEQPAAGAPPL